MIEKVVKIIRKGEEESDYNYWKNQPLEKRLEALEEIREEYNKWKYADQQGFQRVYRIIKRKRS